MKFLKYLLISILLLASIGFIWLWQYPGPAITFDLGGEFEYASLQNIPLNQYEKQKTFVSLTDETKIAANIFLPTNSKTEKVPTIFIFTPYNRSMIVPDMKWWERALSKAYLGNWGPVYAFLPSRKALQTLTANGYAIVVADMRGTGASAGYTAPMSPQLKKDGIEMINWIAKQDWSDGKVGMHGPSYLGWIQLAIASEKPDALKCINPSIMGMDIYMEAQKQGGILMTKWSENFNKQLRLMNLNAFAKEEMLPIYPAEPVIDEDGDGDFSDEIPLYTNTAGNLFVDAATPKYADDNQRTNNYYFNHTKEHLKDIWTGEVIKNWPYRDSKMDFYGDTLSIEDTTPAFYVPGIKASKIPILLSGGWFDGFEGITKLYGSLKDSNPIHFIMAHRFHIPGTVTPPYAKLFNYQGAFEDQSLSLQLQFFDHYLKGINNGFDQQAPVNLYTAFKGWESYQNYPPDIANYQTYYFDENQTLTTNSSAINTSAINKDSYAIDFSHASGYDAEGDNRWNMATTMDSMMLRTELDKKCLVYNTQALENPIQITGSPIVELSLSADQADADIYVYLSDVDENGKVYYVAEGQLRAGWHRLVPDDEQVNYLYDVQPDLPWHGFDEGGYDDNPLADGQQITLRFDLTPNSWVFQKGHQIRISIAGADYTNFELNPTLCPDNEMDNCRATNLFIHRGVGQVSKIELPVKTTK